MILTDTRANGKPLNWFPKPALSLQLNHMEIIIEIVAQLSILSRGFFEENFLPPPTFRWIS
ncbi:hypothetical protein BCV63_12030 [Cylindrospermopsis raciborskii CS-508]|nr:hypothetical protein BCV63_12030 [Cylindrospermopsis raciborskii CS-508]